MIVLASKSPRRKELLSRIVPSFEICPSNFDESTVHTSDPRNLPLILSRHKGLEVASSHRDDIIISSDTIVLFNNEIYGKPKSKEDALKMLHNLNNKVHEVITSYSIIKNDEILRERSVTSKVKLLFKDEEAISTYIATLSPMDKAGAYGIQDEKYVKSELISGSFSNVMGLPIDELKLDLEELKLI